MLDDTFELVHTLECLVLSCEKSFICNRWIIARVPVRYHANAGVMSQTGVFPIIHRIQMGNKAMIMPDDE